MNLESLRSLQKRIREAKGADRELDRDIANAFRPVGFRGFYTFTSAPLYTTDPDGLGPCVALTRDVLPGWYWNKSVVSQFEILNFKSSFRLFNPESANAEAGD